LHRSQQRPEQGKRCLSGSEPSITAGVGKTHVAQALGHQVARRGGDIRFVKCSRMLADLADGHADRTIGQRMREYTRPLVLIVDDFAMREHTPTQSDDLYDLVSDRAIAAKPLILTSNRAPKDWYPLFSEPRRRRILTGPTDQHQPPSADGRPVLPAPETTRHSHHLTPTPSFATLTTAAPEPGELRDGYPWGITRPSTGWSQKKGSRSKALTASAFGATSPAITR
jgi:hypothetical protein